MRIAVDLRPLLEPFDSGVTVYIRSILKELLKSSEHQIDLFYQARVPCDRLHAEYPQVRHLAYSNMGFHFRSLFRFLPLPQNYFPVSPDLIWLPDRRPFFCTKIPLVMTVHDLVPELFPSTLSWKSRLWHFIFPLSRLLRLCDGLLFPSLTVAQELKTQLPWEVTYEGASLAEGEQRPSALPLRVKDGAFFLSLAPLDPRKRLSWLFEQAQQFPHKEFVCAGIKPLDRRFAAVKLPHLSNLHFLGRVAEVEKKWLLRHASGLLCLSSYEGFDLPVLEATKAKTPVILSSIPVHHELYKKALFVREKEEVAAALYLLSGADAAKRRAAVPVPRASYTWAAATDRTLLFFSRVLRYKDR